MPVLAGIQILDSAFRRNDGAGEEVSNPMEIKIIKRLF